MSIWLAYGFLLAFCAWLLASTPALREGQGLLWSSLCLGVLGVACGRLAVWANDRISGDRLALNQYRLIAQASGDGVWLAKVNPKDFSRKILYANPEFERIWGRTVAELQEKGCVFNEWIHPCDHERVGQILNRFLKGEGACDLEFRIVREDGETRWVWTRANRVLGKEGEVRFVVGFSRDVTRLKQINEEKRILESNYRSLFVNSQDAIRLSTIDGSTIDVNPGFENLLGWSKDELLKMNCKDLTPEEWIPAELDVIENQILKKGFSDVYEKEYFTKDGGRVHVSMRCSLIRAEDGTPYGVFGIARDIGAQRLQREELLKAKRAAEAANLAKDRFLAMVSHELRTPLNPIVGYAEILSTKIVDPIALRFLEVIKESARGMARLVSDILDYSMIESGRIEVENTEFDLCDLVTLIGQQTESMARSGGNTFRIEYRCEDFLVRGDEHKLRQILSNLIANACKFTKKGSISMVCNLLKSEGGKATFEFEVADTGVGIPDSHLAAIFEPFEQLGSVHRAETRGVGLGLAICRQLVEALGGKIAVESEVGIGTKFRVQIELEVVDRPAAEDAEESPGRLSLSREYKILVVEDDSANLSLMVDRLSSYGCTVVSARSGAESLELLGKGMFDMVFMDLSMPDMNGLEATGKLRGGSSRNRDIPVVAMTAHVSESIRKECQKNGMNDFLAKPLSSDDVESVLERWLERSR